MLSLAEYQPIYVDNNMARAGHYEVSVRASNFLRDDCFQAVHRRLYDQALDELRVLWTLVDKMSRAGEIPHGAALLVQHASEMRLNRFDL